MSLNETFITPNLTIPLPTSNIGILWLLLGMQFGRSFGKRLDQEMQEAKWFTELPGWIQGTLKRVMDFTHHWWVGGLIWLYADSITLALGMSNHTTAVMFFGVGLLIDDMRDIENLKRRYNGT